MLNSPYASLYRRKTCPDSFLLAPKLVVDDHKYLAAFTKAKVEHRQNS